VTTTMKAGIFSRPYSIPCLNLLARSLNRLVWHLSARLICPEPVCPTYGVSILCGGFPIDRDTT
jgi:hypothetical protein